VLKNSITEKKPTINNVNQFKGKKNTIQGIIYPCMFKLRDRLCKYYYFPFVIMVAIGSINQTTIRLIFFLIYFIS